MSLKSFGKLSDITFVAPKHIGSYRCFGHITPQSDNTDVITYWPGTFSPGDYIINYLGGARFNPSDVNCWFLEETDNNPINGYELFYSGDEQTLFFPGAVVGCFATPAAAEAANIGLSYGFTHTGGQIGIELDFTAYSVVGTLLPYFQLCEFVPGIDSDVYFVGGKTVILNSDVVFITPVTTIAFSLSSDVVFRRQPLAPGQNNLLSKYKEAQREALIQKPCTTCGGIDCTDTEIAYSLEGAGLPLVPVCPTGVDCSKFGSGFHLQCCDGTRYDYNFSPEITDDQKRVIIANAMADCARKLPFCTNNCPNPPCDPPCLVPPCIIYGNHLATCPAECPSGGTFIESIAPGTYFAFSQIEADQIAVRAACALAKDHRLCFLGLESVICVDSLYSDEFVMSGKYVAAYPSSDIISVVDGELPNGIVLNDGSSFITGGRCKLEGTPTVAGTYTFTIGVTLNTFGSPGYGDHQQREYTIVVSEILPATLPDATIGTPYSQNLSVTPAHDQETEAWTVVTSLPAGLTLTSAGVLHGTPTGPSESHNVTVKCCFTLDSEPLCCTKQFTLTVDIGVPAPYAYYKLDSSNGIAAIDSISAQNLTFASGSPSLVSGIIGNGYDIGHVRMENGAFDFEAKPFTIRFWFKTNNGAANARPIECFDSILADDACFMRYNPATGMVWNVFNVSQSPAITGPILTAGTFHHIVGWASNTEIGLAIDGIVIGTTPFSGMIASMNTVKVPFTNPGLAAGVYIIDEISLWKNIVLTEAQIISDYNAGAGKTWPWT